MTYKNYLALFIFLLSGIQLFAQDKMPEDIENGPKIEIGLLLFNNKLNADNYFKFKYIHAMDNEDANIGGLNLKLHFPTKYDYLDIIVGAVFMKGVDQISLGHIDPSSVMAEDYNINGGGVYFGISPKLKGKFFGLTSTFGIGAFSFKEYVSIVNNYREPFVDLHNLKASYGFGAISSVGMYLNVGRIGINPSIFGIFSGGSQTSFTFYGFNFPITFQF